MVTHTFGNPPFPETMSAIPEIPKRPFNAAIRESSSITNRILSDKGGRISWNPSYFDLNLRVPSVAKF